MSAAKRIRWECPSGEHRGVLGPQVPRKNSIVRYCLPCSEKAGVLVERRAPALERKRAASAERRKTAKGRAAESLARRALVECIDGAGREVVVDVLAEVAACAKLLGIPTPDVGLRRRSYGGCSGHGDPWNGRVSFTIGGREGAERVRELVLHEVVHVVPESSQERRKRSGRWHGPKFKRVLYEAACERWPEIRGRVDEALLRTPKAYDLDDAIIEAMRAAAKLEAEGVAA